MALQAVILHLPDNIYVRLQQVAKAMHQTLDDVFLRIVQAGSPPAWEDAPVEFQADLAA